MEFRKRESVKKDDAVSISQKLLAWPDCYYMERDPAVRLALLEAAEEQRLTPEENPFRRKLYRIRYPEKSGKDAVQADLFLKAWMDLRFLSDGGEGLFGRGRKPEKVRKVLDSIGYNEPTSQLERNLLGQELYHLSMLYIALCREDKTFNSMILGIGTISDDHQARKVAAEYRRVAIDVMKKYGVEKEAELFTRSVVAAFEDMYPDYADLLREEEDGQ